MIIDEDALTNLALGASFLGAGGGGDPYVGRLVATQAIRQGQPVRVISSEDLEPDALVLPVAMIGAPSVIVERIPSGRELGLALERYQAVVGKKVSALMPIELGGINSTFPVALAAMTGLPVVDADGMGRAFPEVGMVTLGIGGASAAPLVMINELGECVVIEDTRDNQSAEHLARAVATAMGGSSIVAHYGVSAELIARWGIVGTITLAIRIGEAFFAANNNGNKFVESLQNITSSATIFTGRVTDIDRQTVGGFVKGVIRVDGSGEYLDSTCSVDFRNENLIAAIDGVPVVATPDLITLLDADSGLPLTTESVKYGNRVYVIGTPSADIWWRDEALSIVSPRAFGYEIDPLRMGA